MTNENFDKSVMERFDKCISLLDTKQTEYSGEAPDRLQVFKTAAALQNINPKAALAGMLAKHIVSIYDMCFDKKTYTPEKWDEKINDAINYLLLLGAIVEEENNEKHSSKSA